MNISRAGVGLLCLATVLTVSLDAQSTSRTKNSPTNAQLRARVSELEIENASLARNYDQLLASCRNQTEQDAQSDAAEPRARRTRSVDDDLFWIAAVKYGITETTTAFIRFGWKVTIHNGLGRNEIFDVTVHFVTKDDLVVDTAHLGVQTIRAFDEQDVDGNIVIRLPAALNVVSAKAVVNRHR